MEQHSLWPDHTRATRSQSLFSEESSVGSPHPQEQVLGALERHLSTSITRLAFCMGFLGSLVLLFLGVQLYDTFLSTNGGFHFATPGVDNLLFPLAFFSLGILSILRWKTHLLSQQLSATRRQQTPSQDGLGWRLFLSPFGILGLFFIFAGFEMTWQRLPSLAVILMIGALCFLGTALFLSPSRFHPSRSSEGEQD